MAETGLRPGQRGERKAGRSLGSLWPRTYSAADTLNCPGASTLTWVATPSRAMIAKRRPRVPMPWPLASSSSPSSRAYSPLPSASIRILSPTPEALPQAFMTNTSLTAMHAMVSTPLPRISSASCTNPGRCFASQVGVKAPGTENSTTSLPLKSSSVEKSLGPSLVILLSVPAGMRSPALIAIVASPWPVGSSCLFRVQAPQVGEALERRIPLHCVERLVRVLLVPGLELRDAEQQPRLGFAAQATLGQALGNLVHGLVILPVTEVGEAHPDVLGAGGRGVRILLALGQIRLVRGRGFLGALEQPLILVLGARFGKHTLGDTLLQNALCFAR